ncbi:MAG: hypothetical protein WC341_10160 [Bacteroidales bacterium]|jgi:hypothetical protein
MKNLSRLFLLFLISGVMFSGCKEAKNLLDVTFQADYETDMDIAVSPDLKAGINGTFSSSTTIDPLTDETFKKYADNIKSVEILEVTGKITLVSQNAVMQTADLNITASEMPNAQWLFTNEPIEVGNVISFTNENGQLDRLSNILNERKAFTLTFSGQTDSDDITYTMSFFIRAKVVANPI